MSGALMVLSGAGAALPVLNDRSQTFTPQSALVFRAGYVKFYADGRLVYQHDITLAETSLAPEWGTSLPGTGSSGAGSKGGPYEVRCVWISGNVTIPIPPGTGYIPLAFSTWYPLSTSSTTFDVGNQGGVRNGVWRFDIRRVGGSSTLASALWTMTVAGS